ncbi:MAG: hypothetical protein AAB954_00790 [Patescibacteria group bacterium]
MKRPKYIKAFAIELRKKGYSYTLINKKTMVPKGTLSGWLKDIKYFPNSIVLNRIKNAQFKSAKVLNRNKLNRIMAAQKFASKELGKISKRDLLMVGIGLYIGEGSKYKNGIVSVVNSDPNVIKLAEKWFIDSCGLTKNNFTLTLHLYPDNDVVKSTHFWSKTTGIPIKQFRKTYIDRRLNKTMFSKNKLSYGTATLCIRSNRETENGVYLFRRILAWIKGIERQVLRD